MAVLYQLAGLFFLLLVAYELFAIASVLFAIFKGKFCQQKSPIYIIAASNLLADFGMLTLHLVYFVPSLLFESYIFPKGINDNLTIFISSLFMFFWYQLSFSQILMAVNRLVVMCFSNVNVFTRRNTLIFAISTYSIAAVLAILSQYVLPCCRFSFDYFVFSYRYITIDGLMNYPNTFIDMPLNALSTTVCGCCYFAIVLWIFSINAKKGQGAAHSHETKLEIKYAKQFFIITIFYMNAWTSFRYLPVLIGGSNLYLYSFCSLNAMLSFGANGLVYYHTNSEIKKALNKRVSTTADSSSGKGESQKRNSNVTRDSDLPRANQTNVRIVQNIQVSDPESHKIVKYQKLFCPRDGPCNLVRPFVNFISRQMDKKWINYVLVRDPLERFISGFVHKCLRSSARGQNCYQCDDNITCLMENQYKSLKKISDTGIVPYLHTVEDSHFAPQNWNCELQAHYNDYKIFKYSHENIGAILESVFEDFANASVPVDVINDIRQQITGKKSYHATYDSDDVVKYRKMVQETPYLRELLVKMFYHDYVLFDYPLPEL
ncbi:unnamed protein product, partial [Mesorhabditis spiculigera]